MVALARPACQDVEFVVLRQDLHSGRSHSRDRLRPLLARALALDCRPTKGRAVLAFVISDRGDIALERPLDEETPPGWRESPVKTDRWKVYQRLLSSMLHQVCSKRSGETAYAQARTSIMEARKRACLARNCKWRQRQSGLVRRSCGVSRRIQDDPVRARAHSLTERFLILAERHNDQRLREWRTIQASRLAAMQSAPSPTTHPKPSTTM